MTHPSKWQWWEKHWKYQLSDPAGWNVNLIKSVGKLFGIKTERMHTLSPAVPFLGFYPTEICTNVHQKVCTERHAQNVHSSVIHKHTKLETTQVLIKSKRDSSWSISAKERYTIVRMNELQYIQQRKIHLVNIILSKRNKPH